MRLTLLLLALALSSSFWTAAAAPPDPVSWDFLVRVPDLSAGVAEVDWTLHGMSGLQQVCADMSRGAQGVRDLRLLQQGPAGREVPLTRAPDSDDACWLVPQAAGPVLKLRYRYELGLMAQTHGDPDYVSSGGDGFIFNDEAVLLRPEPLPGRAPITVEFQLPPGVTVATPWQALPGPAGSARFRYDSEHYDKGSYVALGHLTRLGDVVLGQGGGGVLHTTLLSGAPRASHADLLAWVQRAATSVAAFYRGLPGGQVNLILVPVPGSSDPGIFGVVLYRGPPSIVLYFGEQAEAASFRDDWVAVHEMFHLGNPVLGGPRLPWFTEGVTTYYQDLLRVRPPYGAMTPAAGWGDLHDGFRRHCDPVDGVPLQDESRRLRQTHRYTRVYWGGACVAFLTDVEIRRRSGNRQSLDDVLRRLRQASRTAEVDEDEIIAALEQAAGAGFVRRLLRSRRPLPLQEAYRQLGIEPTGPDTVHLHDDAPLAAVRRAIF